MMFPIVTGSIAIRLIAVFGEPRTEVAVCRTATGATAVVILE
jgi:hypothetical protein